MNSRFIDGQKVREISFTGLGGDEFEEELRKLSELGTKRMLGEVQLNSTIPTIDAVTINEKSVRPTHMIESLIEGKALNCTRDFDPCRFPGAN